MSNWCIEKLILSKLILHWPKGTKLFRLILCLIYVKYQQNTFINLRLKVKSEHSNRVKEKLTSYKISLIIQLVPELFGNFQVGPKTTKISNWIPNHINFVQLGPWSWLPICILFCCLPSMWLVMVTEKGREKRKAKSVLSLAGCAGRVHISSERGQVTYLCIKVGMSSGEWHGKRKLIWPYRLENIKNIPSKNTVH